VLDSRELVINRGVAEGVKVGMRFAILTRSGLKVTDPDTGQSIGAVPFINTIVKIVRVDEHLSVGRTFRTIAGRPALGGAALATIIEGIADRVETLRAGERTATQRLSDEERTVKRGDPVIEVIGDAYIAP
jgi:hypothetical protein